MRRVCIALLVAWGMPSATGCVNEYLHGEVAPEGTSSGPAMTDATGSEPQGESSSSGEQSGSGGGEGTTSTGGETPSSSSSSSSASSSSEGEVSGDPTGDGASTSTSGDAGSLELCQGPCDANAMCGADGDRCVELTEGVTACLRACGRGCPEGFSCMSRTDVEGGSSEQCVPNGNVCP